MNDDAGYNRRLARGRMLVTIAELTDEEMLVFVDGWSQAPIRAARVREAVILHKLPAFVTGSERFTRLGLAATALAATFRSK